MNENIIISDIKDSIAGFDAGAWNSLVGGRYPFLRHEFLEAAQRWTVETDTGVRATARSLICAVGALSTTNVPDIPGIHDFAGPTYHTAMWPREKVDFTGKRVAVIGWWASWPAEEVNGVIISDRAVHDIDDRVSPDPPAEHEAADEREENRREDDGGRFRLLLPRLHRDAGAVTYVRRLTPRSRIAMIGSSHCLCSGFIRTERRQVTVSESASISGA